jgi:signal transduction histidine kinase
MARLNDLAIAAWISCVVLGILAVWLGRRAARERRLRNEEVRLREELEAYARLDPTLTSHESSRDLARRVCATMAQHSTFRQVAMLMRDAESQLTVVGSAGVDDLMTLAINARVARFARERHHAVSASERRKSCPVTLEPQGTFDPQSSTLGQRVGRQVIILPMWSQAGEMLGALAVWRAVDQSLVLGEAAGPLTPRTAAPERELQPLEALAQKLARSRDFAQMTDRLARAEKMAGLGNLARGLAHELNNPLTAVLGFAELIAETAAEPRVREDAVAIAGEAMRMKDTVDTLLRFWRPSLSSDKAVDVVAMLRGLAQRVEPELTRRGIQLALELNEDGDACGVRGDEKRLLEVFEHLLNNAVQAVSAYKKSTTRTVRLTLKCHGDKMRVVVSDSGAGFVDAARIFDPFYTTRQPGDGQGLGLAVSYATVHEHAGEISAFNVHPHGASVVVELPLASTLKDSKDRVEVRA